MKVATVCIVSEKYDAQYSILSESLQKHLPEADQIKYRPDHFKSIYTDTLQHILSIRPKVILDAFEAGYEAVLFLGADVEFFANPYKLLDPLKAIQDPYNAVVTPHILEPLPEDGKNPRNEGIAWSGNINSDVISFRKCPEVIKFLEWQAKIMETKCIVTNRIFYDQTWLNFLPFFIPNVKILRDPGYNVAYWNFKQRWLDKNFTGTWLVEDKDDGCGRPLVCFQYSGLDLHNPQFISTHQNRYQAEGDFLEFLQHYAKRVMEFKK